MNDMGHILRLSTALSQLSGMNRVLKQTNYQYYLRATHLSSGTTATHGGAEEKIHQ